MYCIGILLLVGGFIVAVSLFLPLHDSLQRANVIIAISGGDTSARTKHAVDLYKAGWAPKLLFSGAAKDPKSPSNASVMREIAIREGVPSEAISIDETARDTQGNAIGTQSTAGKYKTVILVTSPYHQRRANKDFKGVYGSGVTIINSPAEDSKWNTKTWWLTPYGWWISISETLKLVL